MTLTSRGHTCAHLKLENLLLVNFFKCRDLKAKLSKSQITWSLLRKSSVWSPSMPPILHSALHGTGLFCSLKIQAFLHLLLHLLFSCLNSALESQLYLFLTYDVKEDNISEFYFPYLGNKDTTYIIYLRGLLALHKLICKKFLKEASIYT